MLVQLLSGSVLLDETNAVFPARNFEIDALPGGRVALTVHFYATEEAYQADESLSLRFLVPAAGARDLARMLNSAAGNR
jgi:hypothetical protein